MIAFINDSEFRPLRPVIRRRLKPVVCERKSEDSFELFIASLLIPGAGQLMTGRIFTGIIFLAAAVIAWLPPVNSVWPIIMIHISAAFNSLGRRQSQ